MLILAPLVHYGKYRSNNITATASTSSPDNKVHVAHMGPTWVLSAPGASHVGLMNSAIRKSFAHRIHDVYALEPPLSTHRNTFRNAIGVQSGIGIPYVTILDMFFCALFRGLDTTCNAAIGFTLYVNTVHASLWFDSRQFYPYPSGLLHWHMGHETASLLLPCLIWLNMPHGSTQKLKNWQSANECIFCGIHCVI